jgi:hypothetical protein
MQLSKASGRYPECLVLPGIELISDFAVTAGSSGDVWRGRFGEHLIAVKVLKVYERSDVKKLLKVYHMYLLYVSCA